jgi:hypothetical protein
MPVSSTPPGLGRVPQRVRAAVHLALAEVVRVPVTVAPLLVPVPRVYSAGTRTTSASVAPVSRLSTSRFALMRLAAMVLSAGRNWTNSST